MGAAGERQWCAKLTESVVREIRRRYAAGESIDRLHLELGPRLGIGTHTIRRVATGRAWKHVR